MFHTKNSILYYAKATLKAHTKEVQSSLFQQRIQKPGKGQLMRDYIFDSLYAPKIGFFNHEKVISEFSNDAGSGNSKQNAAGTQNTPLLDFSSFRSQRDFVAKYQHMTDHSEEFLTPVELFQPYYNEIVTRYIVQQIEKQGMLKDEDTSGIEAKPEPIYIYEVGAGRGTLALNLLNHLRDHEPHIYERIQYHIVEISSSLVSLQRKRLSKAEHSSKVRFHHQNILEWREQVDAKNVFVILMEVLDNLPHDKVKIRHTPFLRKERLVGEGRVHVRGSHIYEKYSDMFKDPIIQRYVHYTKDDPLFELDFDLFFLNPYRFGKHVIQSLRKYRYIPTMQMRVLEIMHKYFPNHQLIISDFDELPGNNDIKAWNGPTIQRREQLKDGTYAVKSFPHVIAPDKYSCDIFFGTNFHQMKKLYQRVRETLNPSKAGDRVEILKHGDFLKKYDDKNIGDACQITRKYNPLRDDFQNQSFFLTRRRIAGDTEAEADAAGSEQETWWQSIVRRAWK